MALFTTCIAAQAQWAIQNSNTTADLRGIHSVDGKIAWASGTSGTVLRTVDGGSNWQTCAIPPGAEKLDFRGVQAFDAKTAVVMSSGKGDLSRLYKTTDGCATWKLVFTNPDKDGFWDAIYFEGTRIGWLLGDPGQEWLLFYVRATDDAGKTWIRQVNKGLHADPARQGAFAASNSSLTGYVSFASGGKEGASVYSVVQLEICLDNCAESDIDLEGRRSKWDRQPVPVGSFSESSGIFSLAEQIRKLPGIRTR